MSLPFLSFFLFIFSTFSSTSYLSVFASSFTYYIESSLFFPKSETHEYVRGVSHFFTCEITFTSTMLPTIKLYLHITYLTLLMTLYIIAFWLSFINLLPTHKVFEFLEQDVGDKIMAFMRQSKRDICILSASGSISNASIRQPATSGGNITYEVKPFLSLMFLSSVSFMSELLSCTMLHFAPLSFILLSTC